MSMHVTSLKWTTGKHKKPKKYASSAAKKLDRELQESWDAILERYKPKEKPKKDWSFLWDDRLKEQKRRYLSKR